MPTHGRTKLSALLFVGMFEALTFGLAAGAMFRATRNLWPLIVAHAVIDYRWIV